LINLDNIQLVNTVSGMYIHKLRAQSRSTKFACLCGEKAGGLARVDRWAGCIGLGWEVIHFLEIEHGGILRVVSIRKRLDSLTSLSDLTDITKVAKSTKSGN
jgi:hypothetical protein